MNDTRHCTITAGRRTFAGLICAELEWQESDRETGETRGYIVTCARLVDFSLMGDVLRNYARDHDPDDGVIDLDITIEIDGRAIGVTLDGVIKHGALVAYALDLSGNNIAAALTRAFNED